MTETIEYKDEEKSRLFWFFYNVKKKLKNGFKTWVKTHPILFTFIILGLLYMLISGRSSIQPFFLMVRKYFVLLLFIVIVFWLFLRRFRKRTWKQNLPASIILIGFLAISWIYGPGIHNYFSLYLHYSSMNKLAIAEMPLTDHERIQPINSIRTLINQEALNETEDATSPRFVRGIDGQYHFTSCVGPSREYKIQQMSKNMYEVLNLPASLPSPVFSKKYRTDVDFEIGEQLLFSKNTDIAVKKRFGLIDYFSSETADPLYIESKEGEWVQVVPIIRWKGLFFPKPVFGGVYIIEQNDEKSNYFKRVFMGKGKYYSKEEIQNISYLKGQNLQPKEVVRFIANSFKFTNGFLAPMPGYHEGDVRIPEIVSDQNPMPYVTYFTIQNEGKLFNYFGLEPFEENKRGLNVSVFVAGDDDDQVYYMDHKSEKFIGSSAVSSKIIESKKNYDWSVNYAAESRPYSVEIDGKTRFFWLSTIVSKAGTEEGEFIGGSIPEICLTDANFGKVIWINPDSLANQNSWARQCKREMKYYWDSEND